MSSKPALKEDDLTHHILVQNVLQLLSLQLFQEHLYRQKIKNKNTRMICSTEQEKWCTGKVDRRLVVYLSFAYLVSSRVEAHLLLKQHWDVVFRGSGVLWQQNSELLYELLQGQGRSYKHEMNELLQRRHTGSGRHEGLMMFLHTGISSLSTHHHSIKASKQFMFYITVIILHVYSYF